MKSKEIVYSVQLISAIVFGQLAYTLYISKGSDETRTSILKIWLILQFATEAIGQIFLALSAREASTDKYRYFEWNKYGHIAWLTFIGTSISRIMIGLVISNSINASKTTFVIAAGIWLLIGSFVNNRKARKILTPLHILGSSAFLAFNLWLRTETSILFLTQIAYISLLMPGSLLFPLSLLESANIVVWCVLYSNAPILLNL